MSDEQKKVAALEQAVSELQRQVASLTERLEQVTEKLKAEELSVASVEFDHEDYLSDISFLSSADKDADTSVESAGASVKEVSEEKPADELIAVSEEDMEGIPEDGMAGVPAEDLAEEPVDELAEDSVEGPVDAPVEDSVEELVEEPAEELEKELVDGPAEEEDLPEDDFPEDGFSLFGDLEPVETKAVKPVKAHKSDSSSKGKSPEWMTAMPGAAVKDIRSAISLNDRVMFISTLFREDSMLYQDVVSNINGMDGFDSAVKYLSDTFPEWDMESESVYRFMMAVRRKLREA